MAQLGIHTPMAHGGMSAIRADSVSPRVAQPSGNSTSLPIPSHPIPSNPIPSHPIPLTLLCLYFPHSPSVASSITSLIQKLYPSGHIVIPPTPSVPVPSPPLRWDEKQSWAV